MRIWIVPTILVALSCGAGTRDSEAVRVTVPKGATVSQVGDSLKANGVIRSKRLFGLWARFTRKDRSIQAGVYDLRLGQSVGQVLSTLVAGRTALDRLVIPEGLMLNETARLIEDRLGIPADSVLAAASDSTLLARVGARGPTLEGYLYPTTYHVRIGATAREIVRHMVDEFEAHWRPAWSARLDTLGMSRDELVTLASIIEGEARHDVDRPYVSSVYHNRLGLGMRLQADPTVIYALGKRRRLFERDYNTRSPFNTYLIEGLPPHPINQPAAPSLAAALYPRHTDFLYFVAGPDGRHVFSRTYREHQANIRRVRSTRS